MPVSAMPVSAMPPMSPDPTTPSAIILAAGEGRRLGGRAKASLRIDGCSLLQRLGSEVPPTLKLAPQWNMRLSELAPRLTAELARRGSWQGARFDAVRRA